MASTRDRIEALEVGLGGVQDGMQRMELGMTDKLHQLEETINKLSEALLSSKGSSSNNHMPGQDSNLRSYREEDDSHRQNFSSRFVRLEFPRYSGDDPYLNGSVGEEGRTVTWEVFKEELWARFGPTECEDFDEALSWVRQVGSLRDYQKEFERLGNRVHGWTQKAMVGTFMGGLKPEIAEGIRMFKPKTLKDTISLARMRDEQLSRQGRFAWPAPPARAPLALPPATAFSSSYASQTDLRGKRCRDEEHKGCASIVMRDSPSGHKCQGPQLLLLEGQTSSKPLMFEEATEELPVGDDHGKQP
ncbi:hypothetical protein F0562_012595 [Nyssa sinensis]|uniref:Retrotransposon gag domain-containing protein n=1 Tax=Nyssa sinensis TaxID=561372 RepID=A0A5J4ZYG1_9ASTE|nr:hypothetical protein F0562_012595 [Nyssa sinensis]